MATEKTKARAIFWPAIVVSLGLGIMFGFNAAVPHHPQQVRQNYDGVEPRPGYSLQFRSAMKKRKTLPPIDCKRNDVEHPSECGAMVCTHALITGNITVMAHC